MDTLKAKYQNDLNKVKKCHMFQVIKIFQTRGMSRYFLMPSKIHMLVKYFTVAQNYIFSQIQNLCYQLIMSSLFGYDDSLSDF